MNLCWRADRLSLVFAALLLSTRLGAAETAPALTADEAFAAGRKVAESSRQAETPAQAKAILTTAVGYFRDALHMRPDWREARGSLSDCLLALIEFAGDEAERATTIDAAEQELNALADSKQGSPNDFVRLASFLTRYRYSTPSTPAARQTAFANIRKACEGGIAKSEPGPGRAELQLRLAALCVTHAGEGAAKEDLPELYHTAAKIFEEVGTTAPELITLEMKSVWGVALLHVGRLDNDPPTVRRALGLMEEAIKGQKPDIFKRYNLACAYAVLGENAKALAALQECLQGDPGRMVFAAANADAEWARLRETPEFRQLVQPFDPRADQAFADGQVLQSSGDRASVTELRADYFLKSYQRYAAAVQLRPKFYQAHFNAILVLRAMLGLTNVPADRQRMLATMRQHFQAAASLPEANWRLFDTYGRVLTQDGGQLATDAAGRTQALSEAKQVLDEALRRVSFTGDRARVANSLATCEVFLARQLEDRVKRRLMLEEAIKHFEMAIQIERLASTPDVYASWGVAQLELAKADGNRFGLRQALERFQLALNSDPRQLLALYNTACTYALLGQYEDAVQYLRRCLEADTDGRYVQLAATDTDFEKLRNRDDFKDLLARPAYGRPVYINPAPVPLSGK